MIYVLKRVRIFGTEYVGVFEYFSFGELFSIYYYSCDSETNWLNNIQHLFQMGAIADVVNDAINRNLKELTQRSLPTTS